MKSKDQQLLEEAYQSIHENELRSISRVSPRTARSIDQRPQQVSALLDVLQSLRDSILDNLSSLNNPRIAKQINTAFVKAIQKGEKFAETILNFPDKLQDKNGDDVTNLVWNLRGDVLDIVSPLNNSKIETRIISAFKPVEQRAERLIELLSNY